MTDGLAAVEVLVAAEGLAIVELFADWVGTEVDRRMGMGCTSLAVAFTKVCSLLVRGFVRAKGDPGLDAEDCPNSTPLKIRAVWASLGVGARPSLSAAYADIDSSSSSAASAHT